MNLSGGKVTLAFCDDFEEKVGNILRANKELVQYL